MSLEAILAITKAEEKTKQLRSDAQAEAKRLVAQAQEDGEASVRAAAKKAMEM